MTAEDCGMNDKISNGVKIAVNGALGRMGTRILSLARDSNDFKIGAGADFDQNNKPSAEALKGVDVLIDFSLPEGTREALKACLEAKTAIVIATTGLGEKIEGEVKEASLKIPVLLSPNMSRGANALIELAALAATKFGKPYSIKVMEAHHIHKKDRPSGTAKKIVQAIAKAKGWDSAKAAEMENDVEVIREGEVVGDHTVIFSGPGETFELHHHAESRDAFANGALDAALFLAGKKPGFYSISDVLRKEK